MDIFPNLFTQHLVDRLLEKGLDSKNAWNLLDLPRDTGVEVCTQSHSSSLHVSNNLRVYASVAPFQAARPSLPVSETSQSP